MSGSLDFDRRSLRSVPPQPERDSIHFNSEPFGLICDVWLALEDIGPEQGPLVYYPGSQDLPEMNFEDFGLTRTWKRERGAFRRLVPHLRGTLWWG